MTARSGIGIDVHPLVEGRPLVLGGVTIPFERGLSGHSDGDVLVHAVIDALLGGAGLGDIGTHFPTSDPRYKDVASVLLLRQTVKKVRDSGWNAVFVDATILAEHPALSPFIDQIADGLARSLSIGRRLVNLKAKTSNGLGFLGRGEGVAALAISTLEPAR